MVEMNYISSVENFLKYYDVLLKEDEELSYYTIVNQVLVSAGEDEKDINKEFCRENNIPIYHLRRIRGPIVHFPGSLSIVWIGDNSKVNYHLPKYFKECLSKLLKVEFINNDFVNNADEKVGSYTYNLVQGRLVFMAQFNLLPVSEGDKRLVQTICRKTTGSGRALGNIKIEVDRLVESMRNLFTAWRKIKRDLKN